MAFANTLVQYVVVYLYSINTCTLTIIPIICDLQNALVNTCCIVCTASTLIRRTPNAYSIVPGTIISLLLYLLYCTLFEVFIKLKEKSEGI